MPECSGTVGELADVLVESRQMTTKKTVSSINRELILISIQYLSYCRVACTSSARLMVVSIIPIGWHPFASLVLVCTLQIVVIPTSSNEHGRFRHKWLSDGDCYRKSSCSRHFSYTLQFWKAAGRITLARGFSQVMGTMVCECRNIFDRQFKIKTWLP